MRNFSNIVLIGPMGAGKTSIGRALAKEIGWEFYDSDQVIEEGSGVDLLWIYDVEGCEGFARREQKVICELMQKTNIVLATGGGTVANCTNCELIIEKGFVIYLTTSLVDQLVRTGYSKKRPLSNESSKRLEALKYWQAECSPVYEKLADVTYNTDSKTLKAAVADLVLLVSEKHSLLV